MGETRPAAARTTAASPGRSPKMAIGSTRGSGQVTTQRFRRGRFTSGAVYHHFGSKAGLFRAVYDDLVASTSARIAAARRSSPSPSLTADCELYLDACADPAFFRITADAPAVIGWDAILDDTQELI